MNYVSVSKIIFYSLGIAVVCSKLLIPFIKESCIKIIANYRRKRWRAGKAEDLGNINELARKIRGLRLKPFDCIKCLTFWCSIGLALLCGMQEEAGLVGIGGLACGMLLDGIIMRYL